MEKNSEEELRFDYLCGRCFSNASRSGRPGKVLSCCDFLCYDCGNGIQEPFTCPSCRKQNVKFVATDDPSIPAEVARNISDPEQIVDQLKSVLLFQIKHYKTMLHRAVGKMMRDKKEFQRRLNLMESGQHGDGRQLPLNNTSQIPYQARTAPTVERESTERPRKMLRPSTSAGALSTTPSPSSSSSSSSSSSGVWRTGTTPPSGRDDINQPHHREVQGQGMQARRPVTASGPQRDNSDRSVKSGDGISLGSLLDGNKSNTVSGIISGPQINRYRSNETQGQGQRQDYRPVFNTPSGIGRTPGPVLQTPNPPSSPSGQQNYANLGIAGRPLTPSTLFLPNTQQSQYFSRQQQQQQSRQQQIQQQQARLGPGQGPPGQQGYQQRPSTTPAPLSRLRSPHSLVPVSLPRTPNTLASGTIAVTLSQNHSQQQQ